MRNARPADRSTSTLAPGARHHARKLLSVLHLTIKTNILGHTPLDNHILALTAEDLRTDMTARIEPHAVTAQLLEQLIGRFTVRS